MGNSSINPIERRLVAEHFDGGVHFVGVPAVQNNGSKFTRRSEPWKNACRMTGIFPWMGREWFEGGGRPAAFIPSFPPGRKILKAGLESAILKTGG